MARKIVWSFEATTDLEAIADYIAKDSTFYAASFVQEVREASRSLDKLSERGRIVPELSNPNIRELFIKEYRLIYSIEESRVVCYRTSFGLERYPLIAERERVRT